MNLCKGRDGSPSSEDPKDQRNNEEEACKDNGKTEKDRKQRTDADRYVSHRKKSRGIEEKEREIGKKPKECDEAESPQPRADIRAADLHMQNDQHCEKQVKVPVKAQEIRWDEQCLQNGERRAEEERGEGARILRWREGDRKDRACRVGQKKPQKKQQNGASADDRRDTDEEIPDLMPQVAPFVGMHHVAEIPVLRIRRPQADPCDLMSEQNAEERVTQLVDRRTDEPRNELYVICAAPTAPEKEALRCCDDNPRQKDHSDRDGDLKSVLYDQLQNSQINTSDGSSSFGILYH